MNGSAAVSRKGSRDVGNSQRSCVPVEAVSLLGIRVTAYVLIDESEHQRRSTAQLGAVTNPALLDRLMDLPVGVTVVDSVIWAETADQPTGVIERDQGGLSVTRWLKPPLAIEGIVVSASAGQELPAVRDASLFAGFTRRWIAAPGSRIPDTAVLEAKLCGVGVLDASGRVQLPAEKPVRPTVDGWSWLLLEKAYQRWLKKLPQAHARVNPPGATGEANSR